MDVVRKGAWNIGKILASPAPLCKVEGIGPECQPLVVDTYHFGCNRASFDVEAIDPFMKFLHDIVFLLVVQTFE